MEEWRLENIKESLEGLETLALYDTHDYAMALTETGQVALELVSEVEALRGRLQAVCDVVSDADAFDGVVEANKIMEAVRGPESKVDWND